MNFIIASSTANEQAKANQQSKGGQDSTNGFNNSSAALKTSSSKSGDTVNKKIIRANIRLGREKEEIMDVTNWALPKLITLIF